MFIGWQVFREDVHLLYIRIDLLDDNPLVSANTGSAIASYEGRFWERESETKRSVVVLKHCRVEDRGFGEGQVEGAARSLQQASHRNEIPHGL